MNRLDEIFNTLPSETIKKLAIGHLTLLIQLLEASRAVKTLYDDGDTAGARNATLRSLKLLHRELASSCTDIRGCSENSLNGFFVISAIEDALCDAQMGFAHWLTEHSKNRLTVPFNDVQRIGIEATAAAILDSVVGPRDPAAKEIAKRMTSAGFQTKQKSRRGVSARAVKEWLRTAHNLQRDRLEGEKIHSLEQHRLDIFEHVKSSLTPTATPLTDALEKLQELCKALGARLTGSQPRGQG